MFVNAMSRGMYTYASMRAREGPVLLAATPVNAGRAGRKLTAGLSGRLQSCTSVQTNPIPDLTL